MQEVKISVFTEDNMLFQKILLDAPQGCTVVKNENNAELILVDIDTINLKLQNCISMSRRDVCDIIIPFPLGTIKNLVDKQNCAGACLVLANEERSVSFKGEKIHLTELEYTLFSHLYKNKDGFTTKEELLESVWNNQADIGIVNVYVHYLRTKLEKNGERIIISSRKHGYKINEKYIGDCR